LNPVIGLLLSELFPPVLSAQPFDIYIETGLQLIFLGGLTKKGDRVNWCFPIFSLYVLWIPTRRWESKSKISIRLW